MDIERRVPKPDPGTLVEIRDRLLNRGLVIDGGTARAVFGGISLLRRGAEEPLRVVIASAESRREAALPGETVPGSPEA